MLIKAFKKSLSANFSPLKDSKFSFKERNRIFELDFSCTYEKEEGGWETELDYDYDYEYSIIHEEAPKNFKPKVRVGNKSEIRFDKKIAKSSRLFLIIIEPC